MDTLDNFGDAILIKDRVYNLLKREIVLGNLKSGETINILSLANKMNISSAPIREALNMLSKDGLVDLMPHKKPVVAEGNLQDYNISADLRKMLEPYAAKISTMKVPQDKIDAIRKQLNSILDDPSDIVAYMESDMALHELLHIYADSKFLSEILTKTKTYNMRFRYVLERSSEDSSNKIASIVLSTKEHLNILDALDSRDPDHVYNMVFRHIENYSNRNNPNT